MEDHPVSSKTGDPGNALVINQRKFDRDFQISASGNKATLSNLNLEPRSQHQAAAENIVDPEIRRVALAWRDERGIRREG